MIWHSVKLIEIKVVLTFVCHHRFDIAWLRETDFIVIDFNVVYQQMSFALEKQK